MVCLVKKYGHDHNRLDITGNVYGRLTAIRDTEKKDAGGGRIWEFQCTCGRKTLSTVGNIRSRQATAQTELRCNMCRTEQGRGPYGRVRAVDKIPEVRE